MQKFMACGVAGAAAMALATPLISGPEQVALPADYRTGFINYLDVDRPDRKRVRKMYVNPAAMEAAMAGEDLPDGTILIMEDHDTELEGEMAKMDAEGRFIAMEAVGNIFVMEKNAAWITDNGNWDYAWYQADGSARPDASFDGCFACHNNRADRDYNFTFSNYVADQAR